MTLYCEFCKSCRSAETKGYLLKWWETKLVIGCALFHDILKPAARMCKALQDDEVCIVGAIEAVLKTVQAIESVQTVAFEDLLTVKKILARVKKGSGCYIPGSYSCTV